MKVSEYVLERLGDRDVEYVFACPGDGINGPPDARSAPRRSDDTTAASRQEGPT